MDNRTIADWLTDYAHFLEARRASLFRVRAYRRAAETLLGLDQPAEAIIARQGRKGLKALPGIGPRLAVKISDLIQTGEFPVKEASEKE